MFKRNRGKNNALAQTIVTSDSVRHKLTPKLASFAPKKALVSKRTLPLAAVFLVLLVVAGVFVAVKVVSHTRATSVAHRRELIDQAANLLDPQKSEELGNVITDIQKTHGYVNDPNALYVLTIYYLNIGDANNSQKYLDLLKAKRAGAASYQPSLQNTVAWRNTSSLQQDVDFLKMSAQQTRENTKRWE